MVATQKIQVGMIHARKTVTMTADSNSFTVVAGEETIAVVPRTTSREINRYKAYAVKKLLGRGKDQARPGRKALSELGNSADSVSGSDRLNPPTLASSDA